MDGNDHGLHGTKPREGFTLLELVLVLAIVGVLAAIAAPRLAASSAVHRAESAAWRVKMDLALARHLAKTSCADQSIGFAVATDDYTLPGVADANDTSGIYTVQLDDRPYDATIVSADFNSSTTVTFDGYGNPSSGGSVVIQAGHVTKTVVLDADSGEAAVQ
ncbi:MAG: prepilin-type N-terminal cleavage/methylation domain-containing protein [Planctomycetota bacterium]|jgi:prepilin-type N-terminal cleavage/methylation domain-containing protein